MDTVGPPAVAKAFTIKETKASRAGLNYQAANGTVIKNYGEKKLAGENLEGNKIQLTMQCADVKKVLGSVGRISEAENTVVFSKGMSAIIKDPGAQLADKLIASAKPERVTKLRKDKGVFKFDVWVPNYKEENGEIGQIERDFGWLDGELM